MQQHRLEARMQEIADLFADGNHVLAISKMQLATVEMRIHAAKTHGAVTILRGIGDHVSYQPARVRWVPAEPHRHGPQEARGAWEVIQTIGEPCERIGIAHRAALTDLGQWAVTVPNVVLITVLPGGDEVMNLPPNFG